VQIAGATEARERFLGASSEHREVAPLGQGAGARRRIRRGRGDPSRRVVLGLGQPARGPRGRAGRGQGARPVRLRGLPGGHAQSPPQQVEALPDVGEVVDVAGEPDGERPVVLAGVVPRRLQVADEAAQRGHGCRLCGGPEPAVELGESRGRVVGMLAAQP
jgi:hypothetical protein